ncbi:MAG TPA: beta-ketoacyl-ACP synthase II [Candidatus Aphodovivens avistercoris]|nr:beta-ketoacyl-ACP synthase II [Candidatus Aphodovivens avistercoris]
MSQQDGFTLRGHRPASPEGIETRRPDGTHRVVITGVGAISPAGVGVEALWEAVFGKRCCIAPVERFDTEGFDVHIAGEVRGFDPVEHGMTKKEARRFERFVQYAIVAADEALASSGLDVAAEDPARIACVFGSGIGGIDELQSGITTLVEKGPKRVNPLFVPTMISNMAAGQLAIRYGIKGECIDIVTACATGAHCIGQAVRDIRHGYADAALAGGTEESISPVCLAGFSNLSALTKAEDPQCASLPFDARRAGFVAGEGAGAVVLESLEHALARGASIIAEVTGFGSTGDAYHMTAPSPDGEGIRRAMAQALAEGGFTPADLGHLNAHGTGTPANDSTESRALLDLCGEEAGAKVPVTSVKGSTGHTLGAAGALEAIVTALSVANDCVPPTCGFAEADPACPVNVATEAITGYPQKVALSNSLGFGGHNASLAISPFK